MVWGVAYNKPHFDKVMEDAGNRLVVLEFTANWCNASAHSAKKLNDLAVAHPDVVFLKVETEKCRDISDAYKINALPTFLFLKDGTQLHRMDYSLPSELEEKVKKFK